MHRYVALIFVCVALGLSACGDGGDQDPWKNPNDPNFPGVPKLPDATELKFLDGLPSDITLDRYLYYISTQEDGPGLYAYRPSTDDITYVDPEVDLYTLPFVHMLPQGKIHADNRVSEYRAGGVMYATIGEDPDYANIMQHEYHYVSSDPDDGATPHRISSTQSHASAGMEGLFSYDLEDLKLTSFLQGLTDGLRFDLGMDANTPAIEAPKGRVLMSSVADDLHTHAYWLYIKDNGDLVFYDRDFQNSYPVVDADSGDPLTDVRQPTQYIEAVGRDGFLVGISFEIDDPEDEEEAREKTGAAYIITAPEDGESEGHAKRVLNAENATLRFSPTLGGIGLMRPSEQLMYTREDAIIFAAGDDIFSILGSSDEDGVLLTRVDVDGTWSRLVITEDIEGAEFGGINFGSLMGLPDLLIPLEGNKAFWAPGNEPEIIEITGKNPDNWKRTALDPMLPSPESTRIPKSANGWVYYQHTTVKPGAIAYNTQSDAIIHLPETEWVGASTNGNADSVGTVSQFDITEVFALTGDNQLIAVNAANPDAGMVVLGELPSSTKEVAFRGLGMAPRRLARVEHDNNSYEVIAVDTTKAGSLKHLHDTPVTTWERKPYPASQYEVDVEPHLTAPVQLY